MHFQIIVFVNIAYILIDWSVGRYNHLWMLLFESNPIQSVSILVVELVELVVEVKFL